MEVAARTVTRPSENPAGVLGYKLLKYIGKPARYLIKGVIVEELLLDYSSPDEVRKLTVMDCGLRMYFLLTSSSNIKKGDWIEATGRLDAFVVD